MSKVGADKGYLLPDEITGHDLRCVCLFIPDAQEYRQAFLGQVYELSKWWVWEKSYTEGDTRASEAAKYWYEIIHRYLDMTCGGSQEASESGIDQVNMQTIQTLLGRYDGTNPSSVNQYAPDDYFNGDGSTERNNGLCMACEAYVKSYCEAWRRKAEIVLAGGIAILFLGAVPVIGWIAVGVIVGLSYISAVALEAVKDEEAQEEIICCMYQALLGEEINKTNWANSLDNCNFEGGSNASIVRDFVASDLEHDENWVSFCNELGVAYNLAQAGVVDCPCLVDWEEVYDWNRDNQDGWVDARGSWATYANLYSTSGDDPPLEIEAYRDFTGFDGLQKVAIYCTASTTRTGTMTVTYDGGVDQINFTVTTTMQWQEIELPETRDGVTKVHFRNATQTGVSVAYGAFRLTGQGDNPPPETTIT